MSARKTVFNALKKVSDSAYSNITLDNELKKSNLDDRDKRFASSLFYGVLESEQQLDYIISKLLTNKKMKLERNVRIILRMGIYQLAYMTKVPDNAAVDESVRLARKNGLHRASGLINGLLRNFIRANKSVPLPDRCNNESLFLSIKYSCPVWLIESWSNDYGSEICESILKCLAGRPPIYAKVNNLHPEFSKTTEFLSVSGAKASAIDWLENAIEISATGGIEELEAYKAGMLHVQDLSSQFCCTVLSPQPGETILDVCAAPGGKTFTIAEHMMNNGRVISCDIHKHRVELIKEGAQRLGLTCIDAIERDALNGEEIPADRVLCDVPCSGYGIIRRKPDIKNKTAETLAQLPQIQYDILYRSSRNVKKGGVLVYSTCTLCSAENAEVVERFLADNPDFEPYPFTLPSVIDRRIADEPEYMLTLFPFIADTDGFFIARMKRKG